MDAMVVKAAPRRTRHRHGPVFKEHAIAACLHPGVSVAAVALANGLNTNMLRKWGSDHRAESEPNQVIAEFGGFTVGDGVVDRSAERAAGRNPSGCASWGCDGPDGVAGRRGGQPGAMPARAARMIRPNEIWVMVKPLDMRGGIDGLSLRL